MSPDRKISFGMSTGTEQEIAERASLTAKPWRDISMLINFPERVSGLRILDIGAGGSDATAHLLELGADAYALDPKYSDPASLRKKLNRLHQYLTNKGAVSSQHVEEAQAAFEAQQKSMTKDPERYISAYATELPFPDNHFDLVFSVSSMFSHVDENAQALMQATREAIRVTKPGGEIQFSPMGFFEGESQEISDIRAANQQEVYLWLMIQEDLTVAIKQYGNLTIVKGRTLQPTQAPILHKDQEPMSRQARRKREREKRKRNKR